MAGLGPAIHDLNTTFRKFVDARAKPGRDEERF
jgi:alpha-D-ribose 1-methylphosphonate 5-triphosphate synthase subunit PhnH